MRIVAIHLRGEGQSADAAYLLPGVGLRGGPPPKKADRELSLLAAETLPGLRQRGGLCIARFHAELITEGVDYTARLPGERLRLGDALIQITFVGKKRFDECPLPNSCAFAQVVAEGTIAIGDELTWEAAHD